MKHIPLTQGKVAIVDDADFEWLTERKWKAHKPRRATTFYAVRNSPFEQMHRLILDCGPTELTDHRNRNGLDNRRENLRRCTVAQNAMNASLRNPAGFKGVRLRANGKWQARITVTGVKRSLGCFATKEEAAKAYDVGALIHFGEFACLNFPSEARNP